MRRNSAYSGLQILLRPFQLRPAPLSSVHRFRSRIIYLRLSLSTPLPEGMWRLSPGTASPFRVTPVVRPFLTEPGPGDMPSTTWALSAFCKPIVAFWRVGLPADRFLRTGNERYSRAPGVSTREKSHLRKFRDRPCYKEISSC